MSIRCCDGDLSCACDHVWTSDKAERDLAWIKAAVMNNMDVCEECSTEIARAVGWEKD
jgi:hypothetical protein